MSGLLAQAAFSLPFSSMSKAGRYPKGGFLAKVLTHPAPARDLVTVKRVSVIIFLLLLFSDPEYVNHGLFVDQLCTLNVEGEELNVCEQLLPFSIKANHSQSAWIASPGLSIKATPLPVGTHRRW